MKKRIVSSIIAMTLIMIAESAVAQDHGHLNVGAAGTNQNDALIFDERVIFEASSDYVKTLLYATFGTYTGYYQGNITFTALAASPAHLGPVPNAPALGSWLYAQLVSVDGTPGGAFAFWDTGATGPTISLICGTTGTNTWLLSENGGLPTTDPYGHIHGRRFTATKPGIYTVGFRAFDFSTNGVGGGPIHTPSTVLKVYFQAGVNIKGIKPNVDRTLITFGAKAGFVWQIEAADSLPAGTNWQSIGAPLLGDDYFHEIEDGNPTKSRRFYRANGTVFVP